METDQKAQEILAAIQSKEETEERGRLKIFFGYAAGVGKTYAMLEAAHEAQNEGKDVLVGYIEKHTRPDTLERLVGLPQLPLKETVYKGMKIKEFDIDQAIERHPELILIDELAHTNAAGSRHLKRYQDVEEILRAGIDVYTTLNVQHLESLHDLVASITGVSVAERLPDRVFDMAAQVELVDIEPEDLILRLRAGKVYRENQVPRALTHFFKTENLEALREIALRRTADRLSRSAQKEMKSSTARAGEHVLTCLSSSPSNAKVIRTAARMAEAFHSSFTALYVETSQTANLSEEDLKRLRENIKLAEQLGAQTATVYGDEPAAQIADYARLSGVTKIVLGRRNRPYFFFRGKTLADELSERASEIAIYIIPDQPLYFDKRRRISFPNMTHFNFWDLLKTFGWVSVATIIGLIFDHIGLREANIIMVYIVGVLLCSLTTEGYINSAISSLISVSAFNYFFTDPRYSFRTDPEYPITFVIMIIVSIFASALTMRVKKQSEKSAERAYYTELLMTNSQKLQQGSSEEEILKICAGQLHALLNRPILYALSYPGQALKFEVVPEEEQEGALAELSDEEMGVALWVRKNNQHAGHTTTTLSEANYYYLAVRGGQRALAVVAIPSRYFPTMDDFEKNMLIALINECGVIMERRRLRQEKQQIEMQTRQERLRSNLLRAISHDLRTPLTGICGNAGVLLESRLHLSEQKKQELYRSIYDDAMWLINLTENLLSITRIENGSMSLSLQAQLMDDVFREALKHVDRQVSDHTVRIDLKDDLIMARMDVRLIVQVIVNMVNNAIKYTPAGSEIVLSAEKKDGQVECRISDNGPGISEQDRAHLFDMFYTVIRENKGERRGLGLGLSLCRSIIQAHGGMIRVENNVPHGTSFIFTLPVEEVKMNHV